jgi:hypothetical protein
MLLLIRGLRETAVGLCLDSLSLMAFLFLTVFYSKVRRPELAAMPFNVMSPAINSMLPFLRRQSTLKTAYSSKTILSHRTS